MASIFWCCCSKKGSVDLIEQKSKATKEESTDVYVAEKCESAPVADLQSASQCELRLPLLSPDAMEDTTEDLGDFAAVQRETEILRTYRKPPPPKRARQTRAPRVVKSGTNDIFTELHDEDITNSSDKENEDVDSVQLRQDNEKSKRDTRSSMLTEIEQTIAALHMAEQSTTPPSVDLQHEHKFKVNALTPTNTLVIVKTKLDSDWRNSTGSVDKRSSSHLSQSTEIQPEAPSTAENDSPKTSPTAKPKIGPKVSPKPSPKVKSKLRRHDDTITDSTTVTEPSQILDSASFSSSLEVKLNGDVHTAPQTEYLEKQVPLLDLELAGTTASKTTASSENELITNKDSNLGLTGPDSPPGAAHENLESTEEQKHEENINSSSSSCGIAASSQPTTTSENVAVDENTIEELRKSSNIEKKEEDSHLDNHKFNKSVSLEREGSPLDNHKFNKSISVEREGSPLDNHKFNKSVSLEREGSPLDKHKFNKSSVEREGSPLDKHKFNKSSVEREGSPLGNVVINKIISVEREGSPLDNHKFDKSISVEKEVSPLDNHKFDKSISVEKEVSPLDNHKFDKSISVEKEEEIRSEGQNCISNGKESGHSVNDQATQNGTNKSTKTGSKDESADEATQQPSPDRETQSSNNEDTNRGRSQETGKQQRECTEDQAGKGKISKIPVRAGSKPRTSPPKLTSSEKASSPTI